MKDRHRDNRPSPDALLRTAQTEERQQGGRLKIFLGAAPGVGKTYTMLEAARVRAMAGEDVAVGIAETHGRTETAELLLGLDIVPRLRIEYRGTILEEMDLDAILNRRPRLVLVDELAHTNAPGSRHPKRYQDVIELLDAGIDVYTTLNIQHLESLNDAVAQITGILVRETIPDSIVERADEVELVDLSVEDLLERLREGKVYLQEQAEKAIRSYFRPGNLNALRQLALRHAAERIDGEMRTYMQAHAIPGPWPATERLLVSIGPSPLSRRLIRATRRRAERRHAPWIAAYVETSRHYRLPEADRDRIVQTLRLAEELGGEAVTIPGEHVAEELIRLAQARNVTEIVVGKSHRSWWFNLRHGSIVREVIGKSGNIDVYIIAGAEEESEQQPSNDVSQPGKFQDILWSTLLIGIATGICGLLRSYLTLPNLSMVFLLAVLLSAVLWGLRSSIYASIVAVLVYDFFFVSPYHTFTIASPQDLLALIAFLVVAILTSNLTGRVRDQAEAARNRESRTAALYDLSREMVSAVGLQQVAEAVVRRVAHILNVRTALLIPGGDQLELRATEPVDIRLSSNELGTATWAWRHNRAAGHGSDTLPGDHWYYLPLGSSNEPVGVLAIRFDPPDRAMAPDQRRMLEALADQAAVAIERARLTSDIENARLLHERERLQAILLSSISHDLRTPLASILGSVTSLISDGSRYDDATRRDLLATIWEEAERLNRFVGNLLDTTRLESGGMRLNREWAELNDIVGAAVQQLREPLSRHAFEIQIDPALPLLRVDFVLIEQVLINLIDNACKYSADGTTIVLSARRQADITQIDVTDEGIGVPPEDIDRIFDKFYRVRQGDRQTAGTGLGLSICRGIIEEHGGQIYASSPGASGRGTIITIELPVEEPPPLPKESERDQKESPTVETE